MSYTIYLVLIGASAFFFFVVVSIKAYKIVQKGLANYRDKYLSKSSKDFGEMFLFIEPRQFLFFVISLSALFFLLGLMIFNWYIGLVLGAAGYLCPWLLVKYYRNMRIKKFNRQLVDALLSIANCLKAGLSLNQAMENVGQQSAAPLTQEFSLYIKEIKLGLPVDEALRNMSNRVGSDDLELVTTSTIISKQLGGNLAEMFEIISGTIRERFRLEGKIDSLTAQGKLQGWVVGMLPIALGLFLNWYRPDLFKPMMQSAFGVILLILVAIMELLGIFFVRKVTNIDV